MKLFIPKDLPLGQHLQTHVPFNGFEKEKLLYIIHLIVNLPVYNKQLTIIDGFVPISAGALQDVFTDYKKYIDYGLQSGLFACDEVYVSNFKCKGYKLLLPYGKSYTAKEVTTYHINKHLNAQYRKQQETIKKYRFLEDWFANGLTIDAKAAQIFLEEELALKQSNVSLWDFRMVYDYRAIDVTGRKGDYVRQYKQPDLQYQQGMLSILRLQDGSYGCLISENGKRFHSVLTNMRSVLRNFLTFNGEPLVSIDLKNSQPYLISLLLQPSFWDSQKIKKPKKNKNEREFVYKKPKKAKVLHSSISKSFSTNQSVTPLLHIDLLALHKSVSYFMLLEIKKTLVNTRFDAYIEKVQKGVLYEYLQTLFEAEGIPVTDRKILKSAVFQVLFTPNQFIGQKEAAPKRLFKKHFPEVYAVLNAIKKEQSNLLPLLLQEIESYIMLEVVAKKMRKLHPKVPLFTIHDSIVTTAANQLLVEQVMREAFTDYVGVPPTLATETLAPEHAVKYLNELRDRAQKLSA